jgi:hypothetical protein
MKLFSQLILAIFFSFGLHAQTTEIKYLSGYDAGHTVQWDFFCTGGRNSMEWKKINVPYVVGDCLNLDWWDGTLYNIIIATVWPTSQGKKDIIKFTRNHDKINRINKIKKNWKKIAKENN